ncbi:MAG: endolytic transglycosylase MltG [Ignavibacteria bacterium]|nr:endolytic transglycosylase MltG [Ignavibacteria bacterium]
MQLLLAEIRKYCWFIAVLNIFLLAFIIYQLFYSKYFWKGNPEKKVIIEEGKNLDGIIILLKDNDIIPDPLLFKIAVKIAGKESQIISKSYLFKNGMSALDLIDLLTDKSLTQFIKITVPEGYTIKQIGKLIEKKLSLSKEKFYKETENDSLINLLGLNGRINNLEGFLFPDTYELQTSVSERSLVFILFNEFRKRVIDRGLVRLNKTDADSNLLKLITMASIIQGETKIVSEMPVISGVYYNRIKKGMRLEADPTIQYIIPDGPRRLLYSDLKINSKYNTYLFKGLPPGPINNPGTDAIEAAINPDTHEYIFFVATGEGGHKFSENYQQHLQAVKEYKSNLKKNGK